MIEFEENDNEVPLTCLGKDLMLGDESIPLGIPVDVLVVARVIDTDGDPGYRVLCNPEIDTVMAMGMCNFLRIMLESRFMEAFLKGDQEEEEDDGSRD